MGTVFSLPISMHLIKDVRDNQDNQRKTKIRSQYDKMSMMSKHHIKLQTIAVRKSKRQNRVLPKPMNFIKHEGKCRILKKR